VAGCVSKDRLAELERVEAEMARCHDALQASLSPHEWARAGVAVRNDGARRNAFRVLAHNEASVDRVVDALPALRERDRAVLERVAIDARYDAYLERQEAEIAAFRKDEGLALPDDLDYHAMASLSAEARERLAAARPATLGAASRLPGITPPVLVALLKHVRRTGPGTPRPPTPDELAA